MKMQNPQVLQKTETLQSPLDPSRQQTGSRCILCADSESLRNPVLLGLEGENLAAQQWLETVSDAKEARERVRSAKDGSKVWVAGSDRMEAVNLAAALKADRSGVAVHLVSFQISGSLRSRAKAAGLDSVMDRAAFAADYAACKRGGCGDGASGRQSACALEGQAAGCDAFAGIRPGPLMPSGMPLPQIEGGAAGATGLAAGAPSGKPSAENEGAYVLTVVGAGGGTGKSSVSVLCACHAARTGRRTLLLDADLQFGDLAFLTASDSPLRSDDLLESPLRLEGLLRAEGAPALLAAPLRLERSEFVSDRFEELMALLRSRFETIVVNTGSSWSDVHMQLLEKSSNVLFLMDQRPSSIRSCKHALELCASCGIASQPFLFAMNRCSRKALFSGADVSVALQGARVFEFLDGGVAVEEQLGCGDPAGLFRSGNAFAQSVETFMEEVAPGRRGASEAALMPKVRRHRWGFGRKRAV